MSKLKVIKSHVTYNHETLPDGKYRLSKVIKEYDKDQYQQMIDDTFKLIRGEISESKLYQEWKRSEK
jgi:hypothetical protein